MCRLARCYKARCGQVAAAIGSQLGSGCLRARGHCRSIPLTSARTTAFRMAARRSRADRRKLKVEPKHSSTLGESFETTEHQVGTSY
jgi:hypothetical protein